MSQQRRALEERLRESARYFYALKDIVRLRILAALARSRGEMTVTELARALAISQPLVSFHLAPLRVQRVVRVRRAGREVYCTLDLAEVERRHQEFVALLNEATELDIRITQQQVVETDG